MKFTELKNFISGGGSGIYLLQGEDAYFLSKAESMIKSACIAMPELNYSSFDGENFKGQSLERLKDALSAYPFMAEKRIVRVAEFYPSESDYEKYLKTFFEDFPRTAILIVVNTQNKKGAADLKKKPGVAYVDCGKADEEEVARWIYLTLKRSGISAEASACMSVACYCLCNMSRVSLETEKIIIYKGGEGEFTSADADALVFKDADYRVYEMTNAVAAKNYSRFIEIAEELTVKGMDEISVLTSLFSYLRNIITAAECNLSDSAVGKILGMKEYGAKRSREQARSLGVERAKELCKYIYDAISAVKCGELSQGSAFKLVCSQIFFAA